MLAGRGPWRKEEGKRYIVSFVGGGGKIKSLFVIHVERTSYFSLSVSACGRTQNKSEIYRFVYDVHYHRMRRN